MDTARFDALTKSLAGPTSRRRTLRLLAGTLLGGVLASRVAAPARAAQRSDRDGDGLFDDDEVNVYGTNPDVYDTDGDGVGEGEEVYNRDQGLPGPNDPLNPAGGAACTEDVAARCASLDVQCGEWQGLCGGTVNCGTCAGNSYCRDGFCVSCRALGVGCNTAADCCGGGYSTSCCVDASGLNFVCTNGAVCFGEQVDPMRCGDGQTACGTACVDLSRNAANCGACGNNCGIGGVCTNGICGGLQCPSGQVFCAGVCKDVLFDQNNCGDCGIVCAAGLTCCFGTCVNTMTDVNNCGGCGPCIPYVVGDVVCVNGVCECDQIACL